MAPLKAAASVVVLLAAAPADGIAVQHPRLRGAETATVAMHLYRQECGRASGFSFVQQQNPGAGMTPETIKPFTRVLKDGFSEVDCIKDYLFEHGDKFGDNKASYKLGDLTNVSIVHYAAHVPKEDRQEMTQEVCFRFCRTVPEMVFFGLTNGRECYCTPYYEAEASDSSECDEVCDGDKGLMCGGKTKSSMFAMHQCANTKSDLIQTIERMFEEGENLGKYTPVLDVFVGEVQMHAEHLQDLFGHAGDPGASDLMQAAKVRAGDAEAMLQRAEGRHEKAHRIQADAEALAQSGNFGTSDTVIKAEELLKAAEVVTAELAESVEEIEGEFEPNLEWILDQKVAEGKADQYYSAMYFVDKKYEDAPSTCTGDASEKVLVATLDECARGCDNDVHECVGFQHVPAEEDHQGQGEQQQQQEQQHQGGVGMCFLFSKLKTIRYYTGCEQGHSGMKCYAKLSKFEGTSIKPDASGKCKGCLKEAKQADRCFD